MKRSFLLAATLLALAGCTTTVNDTEFSLRKGSVNDTINPLTFDFEITRNQPAPILPPPESGMPPMVSHPIAGYLPITPAKNDCLTCHDRPGDAKAARVKGQPAPAPASHYAKTADGKLAISGTQYNCVACHAPQAGVDPLVPNRSS